MGNLFKFNGYPFEEAAAKDEGKSILENAIKSVFDACDRKKTSRCRNIEMVTLSGAGLPIRRHFDWIVGLGTDGNVVLFGDPCSDRDVDQCAKVFSQEREFFKTCVTVFLFPPELHQDEELVDFFQNAPIALHWLSGTGIVLWANETELNVLGYSAEE
jgi:hypothetical protein